MIVRGRFTWGWALILVFLVFFISFHRLFLGELLFKWDASGQFAPYYILIADYLAAGKLLLWNPWINGGSPDLIESQFGALSPLVLIMAAVTGGSGQGFIAYWLTIWFLGAIGMLLLARHLGAPPWGGCIVSMGFLFSGIYTGQAQHISHLCSVSFLPFIIWRLDTALSTRRILPAVEAGALLGLSALSGYPALTLLNFCFAGFWVAGRWFALISKGKQAISEHKEPANMQAHRLSFYYTCAAYIIFVFTALLVLSPVYIAFYVEGSGYTDRSRPISRKRVVRENAYHPGALSTVTSPYLQELKVINSEQLWTYTDKSSSSIYSGTLVLIMFILALIVSVNDRWRWWLFFTGLLFLACALGRVLPLRSWLYDLCVPFTYFRHSSIFRDYFIFIMLVLASYASRDLSLAVKERDLTIWKKFFNLSLIITIVATILFTWITLSVTRHLNYSAGAFHFSIIWIGVCFTAYILWKIPGNKRTRLLPVMFILLACFDAVLTAHLSKLSIYGNKKSRAELETISNRHEKSIDLLRNGLEREFTFNANHNMILKIPTLKNKIPLSNRFHKKSVRSPVLSSMATGSKRIWFSEKVAKITPDNWSFDYFSRRCEYLEKPLIVVHPPEQMRRLYRLEKQKVLNNVNIKALMKLSPAQPVDIKILAYQPEVFKLEVICPDRGWLLVTDRWSPGWKATVNGKQTDIWGGNFIFRAIPVLEGTNKINFEYKPFGIPGLLVLSYGTMVLVFGSGIYFRIRKRNHQTQSMQNEVLNLYSRFKN